MNLNSVNIGMNKYCGPAVLSILTGKSTDECAAMISSVNSRYTVKGVSTKDLLEAAKRLGFDSKLVPSGNTLYGSLVRLSNDEGMYIVSLSDHFVAVEVSDSKIYFCDNHTKEPMPAASSARMMQKCQRVDKVFKMAEPKIISKRRYFEIKVIEEVIWDNPNYNSHHRVDQKVSDRLQESIDFLTFHSDKEM